MIERGKEGIGGGITTCKFSPPLVSFLFSSPYLSACREVTALFQTEPFVRLKNRSFSSDNGNLLFMCFADVVQYLHMLGLCVCALVFMHIGIT